MHGGSGVEHTSDKGPRCRIVRLAATPAGVVDWNCVLNMNRHCAVEHGCSGLAQVALDPGAAEGGRTLVRSVAVKVADDVALATAPITDQACRDLLRPPAQTID